MDLTSAWRDAFASWPASLPKAGILVTAQESIPFVDFLLGDSFVVVERDRPDAQGARKLIVALGAVTTVKLTTPEELSTLAGFLAEKPAVEVSPVPHDPATAKRAPILPRRPSV